MLKLITKAAKYPHRVSPYTMLIKGEDIVGGACAKMVRYQYSASR